MTKKVLCIDQRRRSSRSLRPRAQRGDALLERAQDVLVGREHGATLRPLGGDERLHPRELRGSTAASQPKPSPAARTDAPNTPSTPSA